MPNVRLDQNGIPKAPVYEPATTLAHRSGVTTVDGSDPGRGQRHRLRRLPVPAAGRGADRGGAE